MTLDELHQKVLAAMNDGHEAAEVVFDTDAACFTMHLVGVDHATLETETVNGAPQFIMTTSTYHGGCACKRKGGAP